MPLTENTNLNLYNVKLTVATKNGVKQKPYAESDARIAAFLNRHRGKVTGGKKTYQI
jgi:hypothetical protein